jgi:hypothetical protein
VKCKMIIVGGMPPDQLPMFERRLIREHAPETISWIGPWLESYVRYWGVPAPVEMCPDLVRYASYIHGVTMHVYNEVPPDPGSQMWGMVGAVLPGSTKALPPKEIYSKSRPVDDSLPVHSGMCFVPFAPTEDFSGNDLNPWQTSIIRWVTMIKYPNKVSPEEGDDWYIKIHAREVMKQPGLLRYFSYKALKFSDRPNYPWHRVSEQWYAGFKDWYNAIIQSPSSYTRPAWAKYDQYPFFEPYKDFLGAFILERPTHDFLRDYLGYVIGP